MTDDALDFYRKEIRLADGRRWGDCLAPFQDEILRKVEEERVCFGWCEAARGAAKTFLMAAVALSRVLTGRPGLRAYGLAADRDQAALLVDTIRGFLRENPALAEGLTVARFRVSLDAKDASFEALASDAPSAYGLRPDLVLVDEITQHGNRAMFDALYSATGKSPDCQLFVIGNAGVTGSWQHELREQVRKDRDWYFRQVAADEVPWTDPDWLEGQRRILPDALFRRLHLNEWGSDEGGFFEPGAVERCLVAPAEFDPHLLRQAVQRVAVGVDLGTRHDLTALAAVGMDTEGKAVLLEMRTFVPPTGGEVDLRAVEEAVRELFHRWRASATCFDPWQGTLLRQRLEAEVAAEDFAFTARSVEQLSRVLYEVVSQDRLRFSRDAGRAVVNGEPWNLCRELEELTLRTTSAGWRFDHRDGGYSDRTVALALALRRLSQDSLTPPLAAEPELEDRAEARSWGFGCRGRRPAPSAFDRARMSAEKRKLLDAQDVARRAVDQANRSQR